ncbi:hypothetical protein IIA79_02830 [bacterium]|nr:hypothetical protein [bacterium]
MKATLNLEPCEVPEKCSTFHDLLRYIENERIPTDHVITRIVFDGMDIGEDEELESHEKPLSEIEQIEFHSARAVDLAREGLTYATELLPSLSDDLAEVARKLRGEEVSVALEMFYDCISIIDWYISLVSAVEVIFPQISTGYRLEPELNGSDELQMDADAPEETGPELKTIASVENLRHKLIDVEHAQKNGDLLLLADLLEYEFVPIVNLWISEVPALLGKIKLESGSA